MVSLCKWPIARYFMHRLCAFKQPETRACSKSCLNRVIGNVNGAEDSVLEVQQKERSW
jgi:hypothetical protein